MSGRTEQQMNSVRALVAFLALAGVLGTGAREEQKAGGSGQVAHSVFYPVEGTVDLDNGKVQASGVKIYLTVNAGEKRSTSPRSNGDFKFLDVPPGTHLLEIHAPGYLYPSVRVDLSARQNGKMRASLVADNRRVFSAPLLVKPEALSVYFEPRQEMNLSSMLKNPMVLMMLFTFGCVFLLPRMLANMDPEELKKMQEEMKNTPTMSDLLAGRAKVEVAPGRKK